MYKGKLELQRPIDLKQQKVTAVSYIRWHNYAKFFLTNLSCMHDNKNYESRCLILTALIKFEKCLLLTYDWVVSLQSFEQFDVISMFDKTIDSEQWLQYIFFVCFCFFLQQHWQFLTSISAAVSGKIAYTGKKITNCATIMSLSMVYTLIDYKLSTNRRANMQYSPNQWLPVGKSEGNKFCYPVDGDLSGHTVIHSFNNWTLVAEKTLTRTAFVHSWSWSNIFKGKFLWLLCISMRPPWLNAIKNISTENSYSTIKHNIKRHSFADSLRRLINLI